MRKLLSLLLVVFLLVAYGSALAQTGVKISDMPNGGNYMSPGDIVPALRGTTSSGFINYQMIVPLGSTTTAGLLSVGSGLSVSSTGVLSGASFPTQTNNAYKYLMTDGSNAVWQAPANLVDPRTYGASCVGPGYTGGLSSSNQGILIVSGGSSYTNGTYTSVPLTGGTGTGGVATIVVSGGAVTSVSITAQGSGYKLRDQLSAAAASIGGTGSGFIAQVAHFSANQLPVYDGVHDDTAAFKMAFAVAQNTGQGVLVPNGCWISSVSIPQGVSMVGTGYAPNYNFDSDGGTASNQPVLYIENSTSYAIKFGANPNNGFFGFEINDSASGAYQTAVCIGTDVSAGAGSGKVFLTLMGLKYCHAGLGTLNGSTFFPLTLNNDFSTSTYGVLGNASDWISNGDTFSGDAGGGPTAGSTVGARLGGAGEVHIIGARFEFNKRGIEVLGGTTIECVSCQFDTNNYGAIYLTDGGGPVVVTGGSFQSNGLSGSTTGDASFILERNNLAGASANFMVQDAFFSTFNGTPKNILRVITTGSTNDNIIFKNDNFLASSTTTFGVYNNGQPPHMLIDVYGLIGNYNTLSPTMTITGCSASNVVGGARTAAFTSGTTGACNVTVVPDGTLSTPQPNGWNCGSFLDQTTTANSASWTQLSNTTTSAALSGTTTTGDVVSFTCNPY